MSSFSLVKANSYGVIFKVMIERFEMNPRICKLKFKRRDESSYWEEINSLGECRTESNLLLSVNKTGEVSVDFEKGSNNN